MFTNIFFFDPFLIISVSLVVLSVSAFIANLNISSDDENINVSCLNFKNILIDEAKEEIETSNSSILNINNPIGDIKVTTNSDKKLYLVKKLYAPASLTEMEKVELKANFKEKTLSKEGDTIKLMVPKMITMDALLINVDLEISVPKDFNVIQEPGVNYLEIKNLDGDLDISNNVGNLDLLNIGGSTKIKCNSSSVKAENIQDLAYLVVNAGNVFVKNTKVASRESEIIVNAGNIEMDIDDIQAGSECNIEAGAGDVIITLNKESNVSLSAAANIGFVNIDPNITIVSADKQFMGASIKANVNNPDGKLLINSNTGNIKIKLR